MEKLSNKLAKAGDRIYFQCPGCRTSHCINVTRWEFDGDVNKPTFSPSVVTTWKPSIEGIKSDMRCHIFVRKGKIEFLSDCTHELAGQTVDLPDLPRWPGRQK